MPRPMKIGFLGMGLMGSRMAANLAKKGHEVTVWNRTSAKADALSREVPAVKVAATPRACATGMDAVAMCLSRPEAVLDVMEGPDGVAGALAKGMLLVDFSTGSRELALTLDHLCEEKGARFVESPVTGSKNGAAAGTLVLMCGAEKETLDAARPILDAVATKIIHVGPVGHGSRVKLMGNTFIALMLEALVEALVLCRKGEVDPAKLLEVVQASGYASPYWEFKAKPMLARNFEQHFSVDLMHKDLTLALEQANELVAAVPGLAMVREQFQAARAMGFGDEDIGALLKVAELASGI